jgi:hypothetical protein
MSTPERGFQVEIRNKLGLEYRLRYWYDFNPVSKILSENTNGSEPEGSLP